MSCKIALLMQQQEYISIQWRMAESSEVDPVSATVIHSSHLLGCLPPVPVTLAANSSRISAELQESQLNSRFFTTTGIFKARRNLGSTYCFAFWSVQCSLFSWSNLSPPFLTYLLHIPCIHLKIRFISLPQSLSFWDQCFLCKIILEGICNSL